MEAIFQYTFKSQDELHFHARKVVSKLDDIIHFLHDFKKVDEFCKYIGNAHKTTAITPLSLKVILILYF